MPPKPTARPAAGKPSAAPPVPQYPANYQTLILGAYREIERMLSASGSYLLHGLKDIFVAQQLLRGKVVPMERVRYERRLWDLTGAHDAGSFVQQYLYLRMIPKVDMIEKKIASVGSDGVWFIFHPSLIGDSKTLMHVNSMDMKTHGMEEYYQDLLGGKVAPKGNSANGVESYVKALKLNFQGLIRSHSNNNEILYGGGASIRHLVAIVGTSEQMAQVRGDLQVAATATQDFDDQATATYKQLMKNIALKAVKADKAGPKHYYRGAADDLASKERFVVDRINDGRRVRGERPIAALNNVLFERTESFKPSVKKLLEEIERRITASEAPAPAPTE